MIKNTFYLFLVAFSLLLFVFTTWYFFGKGIDVLSVEISAISLSVALVFLLLSYIVSFEKETNNILKWIFILILVFSLYTPILSLIASYANPYIEGDVSYNFVWINILTILIQFLGIFFVIQHSKRAKIKSESMNIYHQIFRYFLVFIVLSWVMIEIISIVGFINKAVTIFLDYNAPQILDQ